MTPRRRRLATGQLEARVMDVLWDAEEWLTPAEVGAALDDRPPLAYTTVMTILVRLHEKGVVERQKRGRAWSYHAHSSREEAAALRMSELLDGAGDRTTALARFVESLDGAQRRALRRALGSSS